MTMLYYLHRKMQKLDLSPTDTMDKYSEVTSEMYDLATMLTDINIESQLQNFSVYIYGHQILFIAKQALSNWIYTQFTEKQVPKTATINIFKTIPMLQNSHRFWYMCLQEADRRYRHMNARKIQREYREALANPNTCVCIKRLQREYDEMAGDMCD